MLDIGFQELIIILVIALLVFGPYKLPELGRALGRAVREFRRASDEFRSTIETNLMEEPEPTPATPSAEDELSPSTEPEPVSAEAIPPAGDTVPFAAEPLAANPYSWPAPDGPSAPPSEPFCAQRGGRLFHRSECGWVARIAEADRTALETAAEAGDLGLQPCPVCAPGNGETL